MSSFTDDMVQLEFTFHGEKQTISLTGEAEAEDPSRDVNTRYSGKHDYGVLPELKSTGPLARLVKELSKSKRVGDAFLTQCIENMATEEAQAIQTGTGEEGEVEIEVDQEAPTVASQVNKKRDR